MKRYVFAFAILSCMAILEGCAPSIKETEVSGNVTMDGVPIDHGAVFFVPAGTVGRDGGGNIKDGLYTVKISPGEMIVRVRGMKYIGMGKPDDPIPGDTSLVPKYKIISSPDLHENQSKLTIDIKGRKMTFDIALESDKILGE